MEGTAMEFAFSLAVPVSAVVIFKLVEYLRGRSRAERDRVDSIIKAVAFDFTKQIVELSDEPMGDEEMATVFSFNRKLAREAIEAYVRASRRWW